MYVSETDYNADIVVIRQVQLFDVLRFLRHYFPRGHPIICSMLNVINEYHKAVGEKPYYFRLIEKPMHLLEFDRDAIFHMGGELSHIRPWIALYGIDVHRAFIEFLKCLYWKDYREFL